MLPRITELPKTGDAARYEYEARDGSKHRILIKNLEQAASGQTLFNLVRDRIAGIEKKCGLTGNA